MSTPIKFKSHGVPNDTVNTPQPQATSTVQRKSTKNRLDGKSHLGEKKDSQGLSYENEPPQREDTMQQDRTYFMDTENTCGLAASEPHQPVMNTEKQKMGFGSLSGITGDLSLESCAGLKVPVGQYFECKSDNIGILGNNEKVKPSLGGISETPIKTGNLAALVESTILTDAELTDNERPDERDVDENSIISLTTIVNTLQDVNSETLRRLVDQFLKKKNTVIQDNAIPIEITHPVLVWKGIKIGKSTVKHFTIRNTSNKNIRIQIDICNDNKKSFEFIIDKQLTLLNIILALQPEEGKTLAIAFRPYSVRPVAAKITIKHYTRESSDNQQKKKILLYGYGGCSKVKIAGTFKDASGKRWLPLGNLYSETTTLSAHITLDNIGDLCSFAKITVVPKAISATMDSSWHVNPEEVILNPKESQQVAIQFHPKKEDFALLQRCNKVSHVATINVTYGDELTRDSIQYLRDLWTGVHQYEIMLTVEACADDTLPVHYDSDQSLLNDTTLLR